MAALDLLEEVGDALVVEGQRAAEQRVQDDATAPHVHLRARVHEAGDDLGRRVVGRAARGAQERAILHHVRQAEVSDLDVVVLVQQQVLRLEVSVHHLVEVAVLNARHNLLEDVPCLVLRQPALLDNVVEELAAGRVLRHHEDVRRRADDLVQLDDVRVPEALQVLDLAPHLLIHVKRANLVAVQDLHRHLVLGDLVLAELDFAEAANAQVLRQAVRADADGNVHGRQTAFHGARGHWGRGGAVGAVSARAPPRRRERAGGEGPGRRGHTRRP
mmetsp:Transcript_7285/g.26071  ORF Transcript_7285/g.26071 Transcript_7285/m.26071 type:complete len:273 (+) Transcript_7285:1135-1953(+)